MKVSYEARKSIRNIYSIDKYVQMKNLSDIPAPVLKEIKLISLPGDKHGVPFGSYINRMSDYFGDVDVIQLVTDFKSPKDIGVKSAKEIQEVIRKITSLPNHWFSEFKGGIDITYYFDFGTLVNGVYTFGKQLKRKSEELFQLGLLSKEEIDIIRAVTKGKTKGDANDYDIIFNLYRERFLLRWTKDEILRGWKETSLGRYKLSDAVLDKSAVKIDMITLINDKFIEITNFIALGIEIDGKIETINVDEKAMSPENLPDETEKFYYSNFHYKPFKLVKRAFAYLKWARKDITKDRYKYTKRGVTASMIDEYLMKYIKVLETSINILYTINSELEAMSIVLLQDSKKSLIKKMNDRIMFLKEPLSNVLEIPREELDTYMKMIDDIIKEKNVRAKTSKIVELHDIFKKLINFWTIAYFDQEGLNPPPRFVLPYPMHYDPTLVRQPWSDPANPFKEARASYYGGIYWKLSGKNLGGGSFFGNIASSIFQKLANAYRRNFCDGKARPLQKGEYHWGCHNFTGPGTKIEQAKVRNYPPYNNIDACSRQHDIDYEEALKKPDKERIDLINKADKKVLECYSKYPKENGYTVANLGINGKMKLAKVLPLVSKSVFGKISASGKAGCDASKSCKPCKSKKGSVARDGDLKVLVM